MGSSCHLKGSYRVVEKLRELQKEYNFKLYGSLCFGRCSQGICVEIDGRLFTGVSPENVEELVKKVLQSA
jgi:NADH:ubiquinone oxidoreductase subunit E